MIEKEIIIFGSPKASCKNCRKLEAMVDEIVLGHEDKLLVKKVTLDSEDAQKYKVLLTPSIVINGEIVVLGDIPEMLDLENELLS